MSLQEKIKQAAGIRSILEQSRASFVVNYRGLKTAEFTELRKKLREVKSVFHVVKNTLATRSVEKTDLKGLVRFFNEPTGIIFVGKDPLTSAKVLKVFVQDHPYLIIKGGILGRRILQEGEIKTLGSLPGRDILISQLLGAMQSPIRELLSVLNAPLGNLILVLKAILLKTKEGGLPMGNTSPEALKKGEMKSEEIIKAIEGMNVLELSELVKALEDKFGVQALSPVTLPQAPTATEKEEKEEKTEFDVVLTDMGSKKIQVIKEVRKFVSLGLKEAKELVESAPKTIKGRVSKEDALKIKESLEAVGAKVELR